jgi:hypothetical protein
VTIHLSPEQERALIDAVKSGLAQTTDEALDQALDTLRHRIATPPGSEGERMAQAFERWAHSHPQRPPLPEIAFHRENMIRDAE